jgi:phage shock protein PspC (stress-responsive transcriptional regulator)
MRSIWSVVSRDDTMFGACWALGQDLGLNPLWLRALFALVLFWSPGAAVAAYAACFALVALSRWIAPDPAPRSDEAATAPGDEQDYELPLAA